MVHKKKERQDAFSQISIATLGERGRKRYEAGDTPECSSGSVPFSHRSPPTGVRDTVESSLFICTADTIYKTQRKQCGQKAAHYNKKAGFRR